VRIFERQDARQGARLISTYQITCSRCGVIARVNGRIPQDLITKKFQERSWHVGKTEAEDLCPDHVRRIPNGRDIERSAADRVITTMKAFEDALTAYSAIEDVNPKSCATVVAELEAFQTRVFGNPN
jgi:hypothetical protein